MKTLYNINSSNCYVFFCWAQSNKSQRTLGIKLHLYKVYRNAKNSDWSCRLISRKWHSAILNEGTKNLTVTFHVFNPEVTGKVEKKMSAAGHDAGKLKATEVGIKTFCLLLISQLIIHHHIKILIMKKALFIGFILLALAVVFTNCSGNNKPETGQLAKKKYIPVLCTMK